LKRLIVTADDFGLAPPVNEAILRAGTEGILTTASLMMNGSAAPDAIRKSKDQPSLRVGLHLVVVEGKPVLAPAAVPGLIGGDGEFSTRLALAGFRYFFLPEVRRQLENEVRAQFEAFAATGIRLDHVNAHNHMHVHPTILGLILRIGRDYGLKAVRVPYEPPMPAWRASGRDLCGKLAWWIFLRPWMRLMTVRLKRAGMRTNDAVFGMSDSGAMTEARTLAYLRNLPEGISEIYYHPATARCREIDRHMPDYRHEDEFRALISPAVKNEIKRLGIKRVSFSDLN
jgi:chitin disaccharide deacetylase